MTLQEFETSIQKNEPPSKLSLLLKALWWDAHNDWDKAHDIAQGVENSNGSWVHAYLHRKEGDLSNARYWYHRAGKKEYQGSLEDEWRQMVSAFLEGY